MENRRHVHAGLRGAENWNGKSSHSAVLHIVLYLIFHQQFDSNAVINVDVAKRVVIENFARQQWEQDASNNLVEKCATELTSSSKAVDAFGFQCSSKAAEFVYCMWRELFLTCPIDKQQKSTQCEKLRAVLKQHNENKFRNEA